MLNILLGLAAVAFVQASPLRSALDVERDWMYIMDEDNKLHFVDLTRGFWDVEVNETLINFYYYSRNTNEAHFTLLNMEEIKDTDFSAKRGTVFIIHGWNNDKNSLMNTLIVPAIIKKKDWNIIVVDWSEYARMFYSQSRSAVPQVGDAVAKFIKGLQSLFQLKLENVHLAGHSLGAHIAGRAGSHFDGKISSIVGMDPAMPKFDYDDVNDRLDPSDATYVHVIHTNGGYLAFFSPIGHADFYPNGGRGQKGCGIDILGTCAHSRSYQYFAESIETGNFTATKCEDYEKYLDGECSGNENRKMGGSILDRRASGSYYLDTAEEAPFALG